MSEQAEVSAKWWADALRGGAKLDNGDPTRTGGMAFVLGMLAQRIPTEEELIKFQEQLAIDIDVAIELSSLYPTLYIGCDYGPNKILTDAADKVGMKYTSTTFPWKTRMNVMPGNVTEVAHGYAADYVEIWRA